MKSIKKSTLLELVTFTRSYAKTGNQDYLSQRIDVAKELAKQAYGRDTAWLAFVDFAESTCGIYALWENCTNEDFYSLFRAMGFEVLDE